MNQLIKKLLCILLCAVMLGAVACTTQEQPPVQTDAQTTGAAQEDTTELQDPAAEQTTPEQTTEEEPKMEEARSVGERYFVYRIWNFTYMTQAQFESIVDAAAKTGFNAIKVHIPWSRVEATTAGVYDFSAFDPMIEYVVKTKGMKVAISIDLTRRADDKVIPLDQMQYDPSGNLCKGGSIDGMRTMISFKVRLPPQLHFTAQPWNATRRSMPPTCCSICLRSPSMPRANTGAQGSTTIPILPKPISVHSCRKNIPILPL